MLSAISAYLFGEDNNQATYDELNQTEDEDNDWIFVDHLFCKGKTSHLSKTDDRKQADGKTAGMEESWFVTPPSCFGSGTKCLLKDAPDSTLENLLIEHPSMSVYGGARPCATGASPEEGPEKSYIVDKPSGTNRHVGQGKVFLCETKTVRVPLKDLGCNYGNDLAYTATRKGARRSNHTQQRALHGRHSKKLNRRDGKHVGMVGKRAA